MGWVVSSTPWPLNPRERTGTHCLCNFHTDIFHYSVLPQFPWSYVTKSYILDTVKLIGNPRRSWRVSSIADFFGLSCCPRLTKYFFFYLTTFVNIYTKHSCCISPNWKWRTVRLQLVLQFQSFVFGRMLIYKWSRYRCVLNLIESVDLC